MKIDQAFLIQLVQDRPVLWDKKAEVYGDKRLYFEAWREVYKNMKPNFDELSHKEKYDFGTAVTKKWRNMRDSWIKCHKKIKSLPEKQAKKHHRYIFYDEVKFLKKLFDSPHDFVETGPPKFRKIKISNYNQIIESNKRENDNSKKKIIQVDNESSGMSENSSEEDEYIQQNETSLSGITNIKQEMNDEDSFTDDSEENMEKYAKLYSDNLYKNTKSDFGNLNETLINITATDKNCDTEISDIEMSNKKMKKDPDEVTTRVVNFIDEGEEENDVKGINLCDIPSKKRKRALDEIEVFVDGTEKEIEQNFCHKKRKTKETNIISKEDTSSKDSVQIDTRIMHFFKSVAPTVNSFNDEDFSEFQFEVLKIIRNIKHKK